MRQKMGIALIVYLIFLVFTMNVFADDMTIEDRILSDREIASSIEILSPALGSDGDVLINDENLYINIRLNQSVKVYYSLYKIDPRIFGSDIKVTTTNHHISVFDESETMVEGTEEIIDGSEEIVIEETEEPIEEVVIPEILSESDKEKFRTRIILDYNSSKVSLSEAKRLLDDYEVLIAENFEDAPFLVDLTTMTSEQKEMQNKLEELKSLVKEKKEEFNYTESKYNQLFEKLILEQEEVKISEVLPYYKSEIEDVDSGEYKMVFYSDNEAQKAIKVFYFTVKTSEETIEKIVDTIPNDINGIWKIKPLGESIQN